MPIGTARILHHQHVHYFRKRVNYNAAGIAAGVLVGTLPAGAMLLALNVRVNTAFNAGGTNAINVGTTATGSEILTDAGTAGARSPAVPSLTFATDTDFYVSYAQTAGAGSLATAGQADIVIQYAPNNDQ